MTTGVFALAAGVLMYARSPASGPVAGAAADLPGYSLAVTGGEEAERAADPAPTTAVDGKTCTTAECHPEVKDYKAVHGPVNVNACDACHKLMDPIGFAFEHYDGFGRHRDSENGVAIDATHWIQAAGTNIPVAIFAMPATDKIQAVRRIVQP